jgi:molecular chaperone HscC
LLIRGNAGVLSEQELQQRLAALQRIKVHPRDEAQNGAVIERGRRLYKESLGDMRAGVGDALNAMAMALER